jgi:hypothetical protein
MDPPPVVCSRELGKTRSIVHHVCSLVAVGLPFRTRLITQTAGFEAWAKPLLESIGCAVGTDGQISFDGPLSDAPPHFFEVFIDGKHAGSARLEHAEYAAFCAKPTPAWNMCGPKMIK